MAIKNIRAKLKKVGSYILAAIGISAVVLLAQYLMQGSSRSSSGSYAGSGPVGRSSYPSVFYDTGSAAPSSEMTQPSASPIPAPRASGGDALGGSGQPVPMTERKVVKKDDLKLLVAKAEDTADEIGSIAATLGGYVDGSHIYEISDTAKTGNVTIKVPAGTFEKAVKQVKALAIKVESEKIAASDVTAAWVDLQATLKNLKAEEAQYIEIMKQAKKVADILPVAEHLSSVRGDIERLQGKISLVSDQVELSSISVSLDEEADAQVFGLRWRPLVVIKQSLRNMLTGLSEYADAMIGFIFILPVLILWVVTALAALWVVRKAYRLVKNRFFD